MPTSIGPYELDEALGAGALGVTYRARDRRTNATVALKLLHRSLTPDIDSAARLRREARAASGLDHPNIAHVVEYGEDSGGLYIASEFAEGETLRARLQREHCLSEAEAHGIAVCVAHALNAADAVRVVHRNLTPENIFLSEDGQLRLCDFGVTQALDAATPTSYAAFISAPAYAAPELRERRGDIRSDLYSLGAILFETLTGQPPSVPHANGNGNGNGNAGRGNVARTPNFGTLGHTARSLAPIVQRLLKPNPVDRYASPAELVRALQTVGPLASAPSPSVVAAATVLAVAPVVETTVPAVAKPLVAKTVAATDAAPDAPLADEAVPGKPRRGLGRLWRNRRETAPPIDHVDALADRLDELLADDVLTIEKEAEFVEFATARGVVNLDAHPELRQRLAIGRANDARLPVVDADGAHCKLQAGETLHLEVACSLVSNPGGLTNGGFDFPVVKGRPYRRGPAELPELDGALSSAGNGHLSVTSRRVVFSGPTESQESRYDRLVFVRIFADGIGISVSNRQEICTYRPEGASGEVVAAIINAAAQRMPAS